MTENSSERNQRFPSHASIPQVSEELASAIEQALNRNPSEDAVERLRLAAEQFPQMFSTPIPEWTWLSKTTWATAACLSVMVVLIVALKKNGSLQTQVPQIEIETVIESDPMINSARSSTKVTLVSTTYQRVLDDLDAVESRMNECRESLLLAEVHRDIQDTLYEFRQWPHRRFDKNKGDFK